MSDFIADYVGSNALSAEISDIWSAEIELERAERARGRGLQRRLRVRITS